MKKNEKKIIEKIESTIINYSKDKSIYYDELNKTYKEYRSIILPDKTTKDLYLNHMDKICDLIIFRKKSKLYITLMLFIFTITLMFTTYSYYKYQDIKNNLENNIIKTSNTTSLIVSYKNDDTFNIGVIGDGSSYLTLDPLKIDLYASNKEKESKEIEYKVYIIEKEEYNSLIRDNIAYNISILDKDNGINYIKDQKEYNGKILIYSGTIKTDEDIELNLRMWNKENNLDSLNYKYKFNIYIEGYLK